ncbi:MAG: UDP-glucose 6-dehydrogenase [Candidatus Parcubacteria bacterium]|nr:MAG: UDP-glucose 6-dehydrogenase [Candidatus Parcubacteria bacterium]
MKVKNIGVFGLGKLGSCFATCFAYRGFNVLGCDINENIVNKINNHQAPFLEPNLQGLIDKSKNKLRATTDPKEVFNFSDIYFFIVPTPSNKDGSFSNEYLKKAIKQLADNLKQAKQFKIFAITSTVSPLSTQNEIIPFIEKLSGKKFNQDFTVIYNPTFIAIGDIIKGILEPDLVLIGENNKQAGDIIESLWKKVCLNNPFIARMSIVSAEITKIAINSYITTRISFANMLGNICERIPGAEIDKITEAMGKDKRIGPYYFRYGTAYGGPCFPRDNKAFNNFAKRFSKIDALIPMAAHKINEFQTKFLGDKILSILKENKLKSLTIIGLAYKPKTYVIEESASINLIKYLLKKNKNLKITVYDPIELATEETKKIFSNDIDYAYNLESAIKNKLIILMLPDKIIKSKLPQNKIIINCWRNLSWK